MLLTAFLLSTVSTYAMFLVAALGVGLAGASFVVGFAYTSKWFGKERQGTALGIFGVGYAGVAVTNFGAPFFVLALGWEQTVQIYAICPAIMAIIFFFLAKDDPAISKRRETGERLQLASLEFCNLLLSWVRRIGSIGILSAAMLCWCVRIETGNRWYAGRSLLPAGFSLP